MGCLIDRCFLARRKAAVCASSLPRALMVAAELPLASNIKVVSLNVPTEQAELAAANSIHVPPNSPLTASRMLEVLPCAESEPVLPRVWPSAASKALSHPGMAGLVACARGLGYHVAVDTSLRTTVHNSGALRGRAEDLVHHLQTIGGYFSRRRRCVGLASDSAWHEAVHEMCHLKFDERVRCARAGALHHEPLHLHWERMTRRGYSELTAEELVCRAHEMHALRARPSMASAAKALLVWDSMNLEAFRELSAIPPERRTAAQAEELRRVKLLRATVTGPLPRLGAVVAFGLVTTLSLGQLFRSVWKVRQGQGCQASPQCVGAAPEAE
jgi:hypothetical protein